MSDVAKTDWRYLTEQARKLEAERDGFKAVAQRVHAECGPFPTRYSDGAPCVMCFQCRSYCRPNEVLSHDPDCLWLAADELLKKAGNT